MSKVMTREEFIELVTGSENEVADSVEWIRSAAAVSAYISIEHLALEKDDIVAAIQKLAAAMPASMVQAATSKLESVESGF